MSILEVHLFKKFFRFLEYLSKGKTDTQLILQVFVARSVRNFLQDITWKFTPRMEWQNDNYNIHNFHPGIYK